MSEQQPWKILLIDDEPSIRNVTGIALRDAGYSVETAGDGMEGLSVCRRFEPHIIVTDIRMPRMDGIGVLEAVKEQHPDTEVIVVTAYGDIETAIRALQLDASDFITKPVHDDALDIALQRAIKRYQDKKKLEDYTRFLEEGWNQATRELMEAFRFEKSLIENSMDGIAGCDKDETIITFNKSMESMLGYSRSEVIRSMKLSGLFAKQDYKSLKLDFESENFGGKNRLFAYETALITRSELRLPVQVSASAIAENEQQEGGLVLFFRDLRKIRKLEREMADQAKILHQDKMMSLGRLAASVVHEINNPLSGILNYIKLMKKIVSRKGAGEDTPVKFAEYLEIVESETERCCGIVSNLLTFSRKSPEQFSLVSIEELIERCIVLSQHKLQLSGIELRRHTEPEPGRVRGDINQLQQCLINLIFNAVDAMPDGGILEIKAGYDKRAGQITISVTDTGTGISEQDLPRIFEPFHTSKQEGYGVGLGLSTVYGIMETHGGKVDVRSTPGTGTTFYLHLPAAA